MRDGVRFLLGDQPRELRGIDPTLTVLDYLRGLEHRMGTKEGCAEGDCGACTVIVARPEDGRLRYDAVNACIRFVATLDGCQLLTVEDLRGATGELHPVQAALVAYHGSQCGFCTPGIVMSLVALRLRGVAPTRAALDDTLAGNLCRCTGYGPIIEAGEAASGAEPLGAREPGTIAALKALDAQSGLTVQHGKRRLIAPVTLEELSRVLLEHPSATILAGATDVGLWVTKQHKELETLVWLGRVAELRRIDATAHGLRIGAAVTWAEAAPALARHWPAMGELLRRFGGSQVRAMATVCGNLANGSPIGDGAPILIAAGAALGLRHGDERRELPLEAFFLGYGKQDRRPGELVEDVLVPLPGPLTVFRCYKIGKRLDQDISAVCAAFRLEIEAGIVVTARVAYGGMAAVPKRAAAVEAALVGRPWAAATVEAAMAALATDFQPIDDLRASAAYRLKVAQNLIRKCFLETAEGAAPLVRPRAPADV